MRIQRWFRQTTGKKLRSGVIRSILAYISTSSEAAAFQDAKKYISQNAEDMYGVEGHVDLMLSRSAHISLSVGVSANIIQNQRQEFGGFFYRFRLLARHVFFFCFTTHASLTCLNGPRAGYASEDGDEEEAG